MGFTIPYRRAGTQNVINVIVSFLHDHQSLFIYFLTTIKKDNISIDVVIALTKLGNTIILDRVTGETIFDFVKKRAPTSKYQVRELLYINLM